MKWALILFIIVNYGCGSGGSTDISTPGSGDESEDIGGDVSYQTGDIVNTIPFPAGITYVADVFYDKAIETFWLLGFNNNVCEGAVLVNIDSEGTLLSTISLVSPAFFLNCSSEVTRVDQYFHITSYGWSNGSPQSFIYKVDMDGNTVESFPCPASSTGGFCEGITWDGQYFWSAASDNKNLTQFSSDGSVHAVLNDAVNYIMTTDISYDAATEQLIVSLNNRLYFIDPSTGIQNNVIHTGYTRNGDWDNPLFWAVNYSQQQIESIYRGN